MLRPGRGGSAPGRGGYPNQNSYGGGGAPPPPPAGSPYGGYSGSSSAPSSGGYAGGYGGSGYAAQAPAPPPAPGGAYGGYGGVGVTNTGYGGYASGGGASGGYAGSGGGGGYTANASSGYAAATPAQGSFKDKQRGKKKAGGGGMCSIFTRLWFWTTFIALVSGAVAMFYRNQVQMALAKGSELIQGPVVSMDQLMIEMETIAGDVDRNARHIKSMKETVRLANEKKLAAEQEKAKLQKRVNDLTNLYESPEYEKEQQRLKSREEAWQKQVQALQEATSREARRSVLEEFGKPPYQVEFAIDIPQAKEPKLYFVVEMASLDLVPHAVQLFLKQVKNKLWDNTWFYINGPHVLQAGPQVEEDEIPEGEDERSAALLPFKKLDLDSLVFPEYSPEYPHVPWTLGFTGRPGGPDFYINKVDNTAGHGPGGQFHHDLDEYADSCFAKVIHGFEVLERLATVETLESGEWQFFFEYPVNIVSAALLSRPIRTDIEKMNERKGGFRPWVASESKVDRGGETHQTPPEGQEKPMVQEKEMKRSEGGEKEHKKKFHKYKLEDQVEP